MKMKETNKAYLLLHKISKGGSFPFSSSEILFNVDLSTTVTEYLPYNDLMY